MGGGEAQSMQVSPGIARAMKGLRGFAAQASGAYSKLGETLKKVIPSVELLGQAFAKMRGSLATVVGATDNATSSFKRLRMSLLTLAPLVAGLTIEFGALAKSLVTVSGAATSAMSGLTAAAGKAAMSTGVLTGAVGALLIPIAGIAAVAATAYVAIFKWQEIPGWLKAILLIASPLVWVIRAIATAFNVATAPIRLFRSVTSEAIAALLAPLRLLQSTAKSVAGGVVSSLKWIGSTIASLPIRIVLPSFASIGKAAAWIGSSFQGLATATEQNLGRILGPVKQAAHEFAQAGTEAAKLADAAGLSVEEMTALGYAAEKVGGSAAGLSSAVATMNSALEDAHNGGQETSAAFAALGVNVGELAAMKPEQRFIALAEAINSLASPLERSAMAQKLFGSAGESLLPMLNQGRAGLANMTGEAKRLGLVMSGPQAKAAKAMTEAYATMRNAMTGLWRAIGAAVAPAMTETAKNMTKLVSAVTGWLAKNQPLIAQLFKIGSTIATVAGGIVTLGAALATMTPQMIGLVTATAAGWLAWSRYGDTIKRVLGGSLAVLDNFLAESKRVLGGVWAAIEGGELELAIQVAMAGAAKAWVEGWRLLASISNESLGGIFNAIAAGDWSSALDQAWSAAQEGFTQAVDALDEIFTGLKTTVDGVITYIRQQINVAISEVSRLAMAALEKANTVATILARFDPTGKIGDSQAALAKGLKGSGLASASTGFDAANAALASDAEARRLARDADFAARSETRQARIEDFQNGRTGAQANAAANAANMGNVTDARLADLIAKANAARDAAAGVNAADIERRRRLAGGMEAAQSRSSAGGFGATFSAAALMAQGGSVQKEIAAATKATARDVKRLADNDAKRGKEAMAAQVAVIS